MDAQVGGRPILLHRGENMLHRVSTSTSSRHRASPPCVSLRGNLLRNLPHDSSLSLSLSLQRLRVRLSVRPSTLYICVCGSRPFVLLAKPPASSRPLHSSPSPSITLSLSLSLAPRFSLYRTSLASMEREARTAAHLFALIGGHR